MAALPISWKNWVIENLLKGVQGRVLLDTLLENGFTFEAAKNALGSHLPANLTHPKNRQFYETLSRPTLLENLHTHRGRFIEKSQAQLLQLDDFLSTSECEQIIALAKSKLRPSEVTTEDGYEGFRTSSTCDLTYLNNSLADQLDQKIIQCLGLGTGENEVIQAQHYHIGQQFKAHTDYFEPGSEGYRKFKKDGGQRTWTFMVYLNEECEGGETEFVELGLKFKPKTGMALVWNNLLTNGTPNPLTLHQAHPVLAGEKLVITKWFREEN